MERHYLHFLAPGYDRDEVLFDLMTDYGNDIWNYAFFLTRRSDAADDISQEVFLSAYKQLYSYKGECSVKTWLLTITRNKSINFLRSAFVRKVTLWEQVMTKNVNSPSAEDILFARNESRDIWLTVMKLSKKYREVIILVYHYELSIKDIKDLLQISEGTVKSRLFRAKQKLSSLMKSNEEMGG